MIYRKGWQEYILDKAAIINPSESLQKGKLSKKVAMEVLQPFRKKIPYFSIEPYHGGTKFRNGDVIVARITPSLENGKVAFVDILNENEIGFGSTEYIVLREKEGISDKHFLYYFSISKIFREIAILSMTGTSGRQRVETDVVKKLSFLLPPLSEQKAIAEVLGSLDDMIDLLNRQNKTLEALAQTLFRKWFVEDANSNWEEGVVDNIVTIEKGEKIGAGERGYLEIGDIHTQTRDYNIRNKEKLTTAGATQVPKNTLLISTVRPTRGAVTITKSDTNVSSAFAKIKLTHNYIYCLLSTPTFFKYLGNVSTGSTYPTCKVEDILSYTIRIPDDGTLNKFEKLVHPLFEKIQQNRSQVDIHEVLRGTLLPKLMNGKARVKYI